MRAQLASDPEITPHLLLRVYAAGMFPMAESAEDSSIHWIEPEWRGILPLNNFYLSKSLAKTIRQEKFRITANNCFNTVVAECAQERTNRPSTWINSTIKDLYAQLHEIGHAHSLEVWQGEQLVGGLYGVSLGRAFFGESMFSTVSDASKVALAHLVARLKLGGFMLLDTQFITDHLASLGAVEIPQSEYLKLLENAINGQANFTTSSLDSASSTDQVLAILQAIDPKV